MHIEQLPQIHERGGHLGELIRDRPHQVGRPVGPHGQGEVERDDAGDVVRVGLVGEHGVGVVEEEGRTEVEEQVADREEGTQSMVVLGLKPASIICKYRLAGIARVEASMCGHRSHHHSMRYRDHPCQVIHSFRRGPLWTGQCRVRPRDPRHHEAEDDVEQEEEVEGGKDQGQVLCLPMQPQVGALFEQGLLEVVGVEGQEGLHNGANFKFELFTVDYSQSN